MRFKETPYKLSGLNSSQLSNDRVEYDITLSRINLQEIKESILLYSIKNLIYKKSKKYL